MKGTVLCHLLLMTATLVSGEGGAITVFNNGTYRCVIHIAFNLTGGPVKERWANSLSIYPGGIETIDFPEGAEDVDFALQMYEGLKTIFWSALMTKPAKLCFKTWGTTNDPQSGQTDCSLPTALLAGNGGAISVTNDATFHAEMNVSYWSKDDEDEEKLHKESPRSIGLGESKTTAIPDEAVGMVIFIGLPNENSRPFFAAHFSQPVKLCLKIWGTAKNPEVGQTDCNLTTALLSGDGGAISVTNNATCRSQIRHSYGLKNYDGVGIPHKQSPRHIETGESKTVSFPEEAAPVSFSIGCPEQNSRFDAYFSQPVKLCFKVWGAANESEVGQTNCNTGTLLSGDGGAISVTNNATTCSEISLQHYELKNDEEGAKAHVESPRPINPGESKTIAIPAEAVHIFVQVRRNQEAPPFFTASLSQPVKVCFKIWGNDEPQIGQIDC